MFSPQTKQLPKMALAAVMVSVLALLVVSAAATATATAAAKTATVAEVGTNGVTYRVQASLLSGTPVINAFANESAFDFNYNPAAFRNGNAATNATSPLSLLVRTQSLSAPRTVCCGCPGTQLTPSRLALALLADGGSESPWAFERLDNASIVFEPQGASEAYGTEDPRVLYRESTGIYYLLYSAVQADPVTSRLAMATSSAPWEASSWVRHGPVFPEVAWSKSGALVAADQLPLPQARDDVAGYLIWGDSTLLPGIQIAVTSDAQLLSNWSNLPGLLLPVRNTSFFDSHLVEAGPPPLPLSDGNLLFVYNSAQNDATSANGLQYNAGFAVLNGSDPSQVLARSSVPILSPVLPWEIGQLPWPCLVPNVVFVEGMLAIDNKPDTFVIFFGASDSVVGVAAVQVSLQ